MTLGKWGGEIGQPESAGTEAELTGVAPVSRMRSYANVVRAYTSGRGQLDLSFAGYRPCPNYKELAQESGYDPLKDKEGTPDSVFCIHGAGHTIAWDKVPEMAQADFVYSRAELDKMNSKK